MTTLHDELDLEERIRELCSLPRLDRDGDIKTGAGCFFVRINRGKLGYSYE